MSALASGFLWLIPLAFLPVIIHLLNRLRYRTVRWAAMMFLRSADRDASRRARIRQWIILALRCLMLLMFVLALARIQSEGRLAGFFDTDSNLVIVLFDRSVSMEQQRGGVSGRERALSLIAQGLGELEAGTRVLWMDGATDELIPIPAGIDPSTLPQATPTSTRTDVGVMLDRALEEVIRADVNQAEIWISTDRQSSAWISGNTSVFEGEDWAALQDRVKIRVLDVAQIPADPGNRSLQHLGVPRRRGNVLQVELSIQRSTSAPESVPLRIESGGLSFIEDLLIEGEVFQWVQDIPLARGEGVTHARFSLPSDSNPRDHEVVVAWKEPGVLVAGAKVEGEDTARLLRAAVLPQAGVREWIPGHQPGPQHRLWFADLEAEMNPATETWVRNGGVLVRFPRKEALPPLAESDEPLPVDRWSESAGILATLNREPLRLDLLNIRSAIDLPLPPDTHALAFLTDGRPLLTRTSLGRGVVYDWATLPDRAFSNLEDGFVLVPAVQRMLLEASALGGLTGTRRIGDVENLQELVPLDGPQRRPDLDVGRYRLDEEVLALNRPPEEDLDLQLSVNELKEWALPLTLTVFEDRSDSPVERDARSEATGLLGLLGLAFLVAESWFLTLNIRRVRPANTLWSRSQA